MKMKNRVRKKAQAWYLDYVLGLIIFGMGIFVFFQYMPNFDHPDIANTMLDADIISDTLISEGIPKNWTPSSFIQLGITTDFTLDEKKLEQLDSMAYDDVLASLPVGSDFYFEFVDKKIELSTYNFTSYGKPGANSTNIRDLFEPEQMVTLQRMIAYGGEIIKMNLYVWSE